MDRKLGFSYRKTGAGVLGLVIDGENVSLAGVSTQRHFYIGVRAVNAGKRTRELCDAPQELLQRSAGGAVSIFPGDVGCVLHAESKQICFPVSGIVRGEGRALRAALQQDGGACGVKPPRTDRPEGELPAQGRAGDDLSRDKILIVPGLRGDKPMGMCLRWYPHAGSRYAILVCILDAE